MHTKYFFQPKSIICFSMLPDNKGGSSSLYIGPQPDRKPSGAWTVGMFPDWLLFVGDVLLLPGAGNSLPPAPAPSGVGGFAPEINPTTGSFFRSRRERQLPILRGYGVSVCRFWGKV